MWACGRAIIVELSFDWPNEHEMRRIIAALRSLVGHSLRTMLVSGAPSQTLVRR
jgi:hypothetical protein